ncbi:uncharacterized protein LOC114431675 [Parambassis ranga]|uniref:Uncharacterized protein LOC114431675 n=1 Tax=Parambassis ranga TaxID=210632 RepID=A0A6P7HHG3_9TELE|nr:uncharacterized protein LOC114431675 [Parambassis ranga]
MDNTCTSQHKRGHANLCRALLLLFLAGLQPVLSSHGGHTNPDNRGLNVAVLGPDYVTVGVPSSVECVSSCAACTYSMSLDELEAKGQGNVLAFTVSTWLEALNVTCTVTNDKGLNATAQKRLQVLAGPSNVSITGSMNHTYSCNAYCRPSCSYSWQTDKGPWILGQGDTISVTPQEVVNARILICKATNSVSGLFVSATQNIWSDRSLSARPERTTALLLLAFILSVAFTL